MEGQYLIQDVVASLAGGDLDQPVQTLGGLLNQNIPASGVVPLAAQTHHLARFHITQCKMSANVIFVHIWPLNAYLHLIHDGVRAQNVVLLVGVGLCMLYGPSGLSASREAHHHQNLAEEVQFLFHI